MKEEKEQQATANTKEGEPPLVEGVVIHDINFPLGDEQIQFFKAEFKRLEDAAPGLLKALERLISREYDPSELNSLKADYQAALRRMNSKKEPRIRHQLRDPDSD
jgi:hypothetical protein